MEGLEKLKGLRKVNCAYLTWIYGKLEDLSLTLLSITEDTITAAASYIKQIHSKTKSIQQLVSRIQSVMTEASDIDRDVLDSLEIQDTIIKKITRLKIFLEKSNAAASTTVTSATPAISDATRTATSSHLPKLDLPRHSGDPLGWQTFWDSFKPAVHSNSHLTVTSVLN